MKILVCGETLLSVRDRLLPRIKKILGPNYISRFNSGLPDMPSVIYDGDNDYIFASYDQPERLQGTKWDLMITLDPPTGQAFLEIASRLGR